LDVDAMADAIHGILNYPGMSKMLVGNGKKESCNLKWKDSAYRVKQVYESAILA